MIHSMTAFARHELSNAWGALSIELRSVNHRYLEMNVRSDEALRALEVEMRKVLQHHLARGKIDLSVRYRPATEQASAMHINEPLAKALIDAYHQLRKLDNNLSAINGLDLLKWPGVIQSPELDTQQLTALVLQALESALVELKSQRALEGQALARMILERCDSVAQHAQSVRARLPEIVQQHRHRLQERIAEMSVQLDAERLEQEVALLVQKNDVAEELDRLENHLYAVRESLKAKQAVGRRLDFLMQELNREVNTLGSKCLDSVVTAEVVELKVLIEQMREQIQNIE